jgi:hypothetical protein
MQLIELYKTKEGIYLDDIPSTNYLLIDTIVNSKVIKEAYICSDKFTIVSQYDNLTLIQFKWTRVLIEIKLDNIIVSSNIQLFNRLFDLKNIKREVKGGWFTSKYSLNKGKYLAYKEAIEYFINYEKKKGEEYEPILSNYLFGWGGTMYANRMRRANR